jgi:hypothetical protein
MYGKAPGVVEQWNDGAMEWRRDGVMERARAAGLADTRLTVFAFSHYHYAKLAFNSFRVKGKSSALI